MEIAAQNTFFPQNQQKIDKKIQNNRTGDQSDANPIETEKKMIRTKSNQVSRTSLIVTCTEPTVVTLFA